MDRGKESWRVYFHTAEKMGEISDSSAQIAIASPPFTNHRDGKTLNKKEYLSFIERVFFETSRVLNPGGFLVTVNTDLRDHARYNDGNSTFNGLVWHKHSDLRQVAEQAGFRCIDTKIWAKSLQRDVYRYTFAYIQFFVKPNSGKQYTERKRISKEYGPDVWLLEKGTLRRDARGFTFRDAIHPEIVVRCLRQFTSPGDLVISPFTGSGTVLAVAKMMGRRSIGYEINRNLEQLIRESVGTPDHFKAYQQLKKD